MERDNISAYMCPLAPLPVPKTYVFGTTQSCLSKHLKAIHYRPKTRFKTKTFRNLLDLGFWDDRLERQFGRNQFRRERLKRARAISSCRLARGEGSAFEVVCSWYHVYGPAAGAATAQATKTPI